MRLGLSLFAKELPYRFRGKYRIVKKPTLEDLMKLRFDFEREEQNMLILRHPYLTEEQSRGHMKEIKEPLNFSMIGNKQKNEKFSKQVTIAERLNHLRVTEAWD